MKKLIVNIGNEKHELPYNGEAVKIEVSDHSKRICQAKRHYKGKG